MRHILLVILLVIAGKTVLAQPSPYLSYQGRLVQPNGVPVPDGNQTVTVRIYASVSATTPLWSETVTVQSKRGVISLLLGTQTPLSQTIFSGGATFVEVQPTGQLPLGPRTPLTTVPWAFWTDRALIANTVADGGITTSKLAIGSVSSSRLADGAVTTNKLAGGSVTSNSILDGNVLNADLADNAITTLKIMPGAIDASRLGWGAVTSSTILDGNVLNADLADNAITTLKVMAGAIDSNRLTADHNSLVKVSGGLLTAQTSGRIGIGTGNSIAKLDVVGSDLFGIRYASSGEGRINVSDPVQGWSFAAGWGTLGDFSILEEGVSPRLYIKNDTGRVGIGTTNPDSLLHVNGRIKSTNVSIGGDNVSPHLLSVHGRAYKNAGGTSWEGPSDSRLKRDIRKIDNALEKLLELHGRNFRWRSETSMAKSDPGIQMGFIAQEAERVFPGWVSQSNLGFKLLNPIGFDALAVEAIREQQNQMESLRRENELLRRQNAAFEARLLRLEKAIARSSITRRR